MPKVKPAGITMKQVRRKFGEYKNLRDGKMRLAGCLNFLQPFEVREIQRYLMVKDPKNMARENYLADGTDHEFEEIWFKLSLHPELLDVYKLLAHDGGHTKCDLTECAQTLNGHSHVHRWSPKHRMFGIDLMFCTEEHKAIAEKRWNLK